MEEARKLIELARQQLKIENFQKENWEGSFEDYLEVVQKNPRVTRNAFQRLYDMILSYGSHQYTQYRDKITHYRFFDDPDHDGEDAVFGLDRQIMDLVNSFKSAAMGYGIEKRVLLLHGPVGSSKSTICRLLKRGFDHIPARTREQSSGLDGSKTEIRRRTSQIRCMKNPSSSSLMNSVRRSRILSQGQCIASSLAVISIPTVGKCLQTKCVSTMGIGPV